MRTAASVVAEQHRAETGLLPSHTDETQARRREANRCRQLARLSATGRYWPSSSTYQELRVFCRITDSR
jgi:hypothetical protein